MTLSTPYIHQVFLDVGQGQLDDWPLYVSNMQKISALYAGRHKIWRDSDVQEILNAYPQFDELVQMFPNRFWLVDFARLMILDYCCRTGADGGGFATYVDLDEKPREKFLLKNTDFIVGVSDDGSYNNNILHVPEALSSHLLDFAAQQASRILTATGTSNVTGTITKPAVGQARYNYEAHGLLHAAGPYMLRSFLLRWPVPIRTDVCECFHSYNTAAWRKVVTDEAVNFQAACKEAEENAREERRKKRRELRKQLEEQRKTKLEEIRRKKDEMKNAGVEQDPAKTMDIADGEDVESGQKEIETEQEIANLSSASEEENCVRRAVVEEDGQRQRRVTAEEMRAEIARKREERIRKKEESDKEKEERRKKKEERRKKAEERRKTKEEERRKNAAHEEAVDKSVSEKADAISTKSADFHKNITECPGTSSIFQPRKNTAVQQHLVGMMAIARHKIAATVEEESKWKTVESEQQAEEQAKTDAAGEVHARKAAQASAEKEEVVEGHVKQACNSEANHNIPHLTRTIPWCQNQYDKNRISHSRKDVSAGGHMASLNHGPAAIAQESATVKGMAVPGKQGQWKNAAVEQDPAKTMAIAEHKSPVGEDVESRRKKIETEQEIAKLSSVSEEEKCARRVVVEEDGQRQRRVTAEEVRATMVTSVANKQNVDENAPKPIVSLLGPTLVSGAGLCDHSLRDERVSSLCRGTPEQAHSSEGSLPKCHSTSTLEGLGRRSPDRQHLNGSSPVGASVRSRQLRRSFSDMYFRQRVEDIAVTQAALEGEGGRWRKTGLRYGSELNSSATNLRSAIGSRRSIGDTHDVQQFESQLQQLGLIGQRIASGNHAHVSPKAFRPRQGHVFE